jgi:exodeoxyribonuclease VII small subunit
MSKSEPKSSKNATEAPSFEKALKRLEEIVEMLDEGNLPLARSIELFKEGTELTNTCRTMLAAADVQIREALKDAEPMEFDGPENE